MLLSVFHIQISKTSLRVLMQSIFRGCYAKTKKTLDDAVKSNPVVQQIHGNSFYIEGDESDFSNISPL